MIVQDLKLQADIFTYNKPSSQAIGDYMFPGLGGLGGRGGMSPRKMKGMLKNMGINIEELENVIEVVIRMPDREIVLSNASVAIMDAHGQRSYQISGDASERFPTGGSGQTVGQTEASSEGRKPSEGPSEEPVQIPDSDVELVAAQTGQPADRARAAREESGGDLAAAIMKLTIK